ncbi:MAG: hypothetical protein HZA59_13340 [Hydrogenophilales bacterium]|nr:hypothetical protein [Hydrogenophilales bacterium]
MFAFKPSFFPNPDSLRDWFGQRLRRDPAPASGEEAEAWLAGLPAHDAYAALHAIAAMLESLAVAKALPWSDRAAAMHVLDCAAAPFAAKLSADYLALLRGQATQEERLWRALADYWCSVEQVYASLVSEWREAGASSECAVLIERALAALSEQAKLARMRYCAVDARIWRELGRLYALAETAQAGVPEPVMQAWARLFLREMASPQNLLPREIEIVDCLAMRYAALFVCQRKASPEAGYFFDLTAGQAPSRRVPSGRLTGDSRFFGAGEGYRQAESDARTLELQGALDAFPALANFAPDEIVRMLHHVARHWSPAPPARGQDRSEVLSRVMIVFDLNEIRRKVAKGDSIAMPKAPGNREGLEQADLQRYGFVTERTRQRLAEADEPMPPKEDALTESWVVRDESGGGLGAEVPSPAGDWLCAGKLIGFKREGGEHWGVGVIRRVELEPRKHGRVGIQILSEQPRAVRLRPLDAAQLAGWDKLTDAPSYEYRNGILLSLPQGRDIGVLLLPYGTYDQERHFEWVHGAACDLMAVTSHAMHADEFDLLMFRLVA